MYQSTLRKHWKRKKTNFKQNRKNAQNMKIVDSI